MNAKGNGSKLDSQFYRSMLRIRRFEERVLADFPRGLFYGTTHTYIGQEVIAVGVLSTLEDADVVVSNHRCHGHFLAYGGSMKALTAELMGRVNGVCGGRGGSQHIQWRNFYANGILGGTMPLGVGMAYAEKVRGAGAVVFIFLGDGALGEGVVYESFNMASLWKLPVLFILENNLYAQSTPIHLNLAGGIPARFEAFGIPTRESEARDASEIQSQTQEWVDEVRGGKGPRALILNTYRFAPHSKGDDTRDVDEIARYKDLDPLVRLAERLDPKDRDHIENEVDREISDTFNWAEQQDKADPASLTPPLKVVE